MEGIAAAMEPRERSLGWVVGPTLDLANRVFRHIALVVSDKLSHRIVMLNPKEQRLVLRNMSGGLSEIRAKTADNPVSLLGEALDWVVIDEAARLRAAIWEGHIAQRLVDRRGWALLISTPQGTGWFYKLYRRGQRTDDPLCQSWRFPSWTNPHVDPEAIEAERHSLPEDVFRQEFGAEFLGVALEPCDLCGGPSPSAPSVVVVHDGEEPARCPECNKLVDENGKTVVPLWGETIGRTIVLQVQGAYGEDAE
jgi:hypothetical protein